MREHVKKIHGLSKQAIYSRSLRRYLFVGFSTVAIDYFFLFILRDFFSVKLVYAVSVAYWLSVVYNFLLNRYWSFENKGGMVPKQIALYVILLLINYAVTVGIITVLKSLGLSEYISKAIAISVTIPWTYFFYKKVIFTSR